MELKKNSTTEILANLSSRLLEALNLAYYQMLANALGARGFFFKSMKELEAFTLKRVSVSQVQGGGAIT